MILMTLNINGTTRRVSNRELSLTHQWFAELISPPLVTCGPAHDYGGFWKPEFGDFVLDPQAFVETTWPPPEKITATVQYTDSDEASAVTLFSATCHQNRDLQRNGIGYQVFGTETEKAIAASTVFNADISTLFSTYCGASYLNLTLNSTLAAAFTMNYTTASEEQLLQILSDMAAYGAHMFYISGSTLYLIDMVSSDNGTMSLTEFDFRPARYNWPTPYRRFRGNDTSITGSKSFTRNELAVSPVCQMTAGSIATALGRIKTVMQRQRATLEIGMNLTTMGIKPGMKLSWTDESQGDSLTAWMRARNFQYDFGSNLITINGEGGVS